MNITDEILERVVEKSILNAEALMADADILREAKRFQRAYTLYQFAMEEVGKAIASIFLLVRIDVSEKEKKEYQKNFTKHPCKIKKSASFDTFICKILYKGNYEGAMDFLQTSISEDENKLNDYKNRSLYTDIVDGKVKMPSEMIDESNMNYIQFRAITRFNIARQACEILLKSYPLLRQHQKENGSIKNMSFDTEKATKEFWDEILSDDNSSNSRSE